MIGFGGKKLQASLASVQAANDELRTNLESVRRSIIKAQGDIDQVQKADATPEETLTRLAAWAQGGLAQAKGRMPKAARFAHGTYPGAGGPPSAPNPADLLLVYGWPVIFDGLKKAVAKHCGENPGISVEERRNKIEKLESDLFDLELVEEAMIRSAERVGIAIPRRPNADPRAVLAEDGSLP